jgi:hypothetical protein
MCIYTRRVRLINSFPLCNLKKKKIEFETMTLLLCVADTACALIIAGLYNVLKGERPYNERSKTQTIISFIKLSGFFFL